MKMKLLGIVLLSGLGVSVQAAEMCRDITGTIKLDLDATCKIVTEYPGNAYLGPRVPNSCYKTTLSGIGTGFTGLTAETAFGSNQGQLLTPAIINEKAVPPLPGGTIPQTRRLFTSRTIIKTPLGNIISAEVGASMVYGTSTQSVIVDGTGPYKKAKGYLQAMGNFIGTGQAGKYYGRICTVS
ncbi:hypothetical protein [Chitinivorax sp. B]|uniref:hypothetical protein n=1 Tax=Chitinivorax sp. B TaxID=2502235 RepID=UPI0010F604F4|nr:hypothetical protein [Chitinivorax sp. B]